MIDLAAGTTTELVENGRPLSAAELAEFRRVYEEEMANAEAVIITGSLPDGASSRYYRDLLERTPCPAVLDFRGEGLLAALDLKPFIVKPNREELAQTVGRKLDGDEELLAAMRELNQRGAAWAIVTNGAKPVWASSVSKLFRFQPLQNARVVNAIGSGDAMAAGLAWATRAGWDIVRAVRIGIAAATENLSQLETCRFDGDRVQKLAENVLVEEME